MRTAPVTKTGGPSGSYTRKSSKRKSSKRKKKFAPILVALRPTNLMDEKEKFFRSKFTYNPQFQYNGLDFGALNQYEAVSEDYLPQALKIITAGLERFGSYSNWQKSSGGAIMSREDVYNTILAYLRDEEMDDQVSINITPHLLSYASMSKIKGIPTINVKENTTHQNWINGMLDHEIGTHYLRAFNNSIQPWNTKKKRKKLQISPANPTEEGLASLHTQINREEPMLLRSALMYYTVYLASKYSFAATWTKLTEFIDCPEARWNYLMRAKRGQIDTSKPGCFTKDQVYLTGALQILLNRHTIDFDKLYRFGKVDYRDIDRLAAIARIEGTRIPKFVADREAYMQKLERIMEYNNLSESNMRPVSR